MLRKNKDKDLLCVGKNEKRKNKKGRRHEKNQKKEEIKEHELQKEKVSTQF